MDEDQHHKEYKYRILEDIHRLRLRRSICLLYAEYICMHTTIDSNSRKYLEVEVEDDDSDNESVDESVLEVEASSSSKVDK